LNHSTCPEWDYKARKIEVALYLCLWKNWVTLVRTASRRWTVKTAILRIAGTADVLALSAEGAFL